MSFSPEILNKKLDSLQETQDSIVTISQWVLFHHKHCQESAQLWSDYILGKCDSSSKRLSLLYLCNDVVQQARHKRKSEFIIQFSKVLPNVLNNIYSTLDTTIRLKVDRLINVWEQRSVFQQSDIKEMRNAVELSKNNKPIESTPVISSSAPNESIASDLTHLNNIFLHMNHLISASQANLHQIGIQSKSYLPNDPQASDNLPSPKVYLSKLNILEKLCQISINNIEEIKKDRSEILSQLDNVRKLISEGSSNDDNKIAIINSKLTQLQTTKSELQEMIDGESSESKKPAEEDPSPAYEDQEEDEDVIPTYESNESDNETNEPPLKKSKPSNISGNNSTPSNGAKKTVAFSEEIEIKEFERDENVGHTDLDFNHDEEDTDDYESRLEFERHHKDDLELKHDHKEPHANDHYESNLMDYTSNNNNSYYNPADDSGYNPSADINKDNEGSAMNDNVLNLLSKLA